MCLSQWRLQKQSKTCPSKCQLSQCRRLLQERNQMPPPRPSKLQLLVLSPSQCLRRRLPQQQSLKFKLT